uniref:Uncharacterized protein n=1 Tax=Arundo donax TaxID=35708 RepID=A0A0A9B351_ARUDO
MRWAVAAGRPRRRGGRRG